ncbi:hypothetical protein GCM10009609_62030 [Pseudonocardia aurantiaca]|uniref:Uncharacterized protein n=1 Tax=Pseudonocardia aurantiaca TaxID=75290 RepID=A0ABW4FT96_9PSEU
MAQRYARAHRDTGVTYREPADSPGEGAIAAMQAVLLVPITLAGFRPIAPVAGHG